MKFTTGIYFYFPSLLLPYLIVFCACQRVNVNSNFTGNRVLTVENVNPNIRRMQYLLAGPIFDRCSAIEEELQQGVQKPFNEVVRAALGDPQGLGQKPISFIRQVLALVNFPALINSTTFHWDVRQKAQFILNSSPSGSVGSYGTSILGNDLIRRHVSQYVSRRDGGVPSNPDNIILTSATEGIRAILELFADDCSQIIPGVMIPQPGYPLYRSAVTEFGMKQIHYFLNEDNGWTMEIDELLRSIASARKSSRPRAIVVTNPGNPTGRVLTKECIAKVIEFAFNEGLVIIADEVYQDNINPNSKRAFHSFKKVMYEMGAPYNTLELVSVHSASKGYVGECGIRGGYIEVINFDKGVTALLVKNIGAKSSPSIQGQVAMDCIADPPKIGNPSYKLYNEEKNDIINSLSIRATILFDTLSGIPGYKVFPIEGAVYSFPQITLPQRAIETAIALGISPDVFYAVQLMENTGICVTPGTEFGQLPGTYHFRITILLQTDKFITTLEKIKQFHLRFLENYQSNPQHTNNYDQIY